MGAMNENALLVYIESERTEHTPTVQVGSVQGRGDDLTYARFEVDDSEPLDVWGPIFSRVFDHLGLTLSDPGDFTVEPVRPDAFRVTINCDFTED